MQVDLLPKGTDPHHVARWLHDLALGRKVNVVHTATVSSRTSESIPETAAFIRRNRLGRDVYIVGAANVGKSAFCRYALPFSPSLVCKCDDTLVWLITTWLLLRETCDRANKKPHSSFHGR